MAFSLCGSFYQNWWYIYIYIACVCLCAVSEEGNFFQKYVAHYDRNTCVWEKAKINNGYSHDAQSITSMQNQTSLWHCTATWELFIVLTMLSHSTTASQTWNVHLNPLGDLATCRFWFCRPVTDPDEHKALNGSCQVNWCWWSMDPTLNSKTLPFTGTKLASCCVIFLFLWKMGPNTLWILPIHTTKRERDSRKELKQNYILPTDSILATYLRSIYWK